MFTLFTFIIKLFISLAIGAFLQYSPFRKGSEKFMLHTAYICLLTGGIFASVPFIDQNIQGFAFLTFALLVSLAVLKMKGDRTINFSAVLLGILVGTGAILPALLLAVVLYIMINVLNALKDEPFESEKDITENME